MGCSRKNHAIRAYLGGTRDGVFTPGAIPESEYRIVTKDGKVFHDLIQMDKVSPGQRFDIHLTTNGFDHCLLGAPGEQGESSGFLLLLGKWNLAETPVPDWKALGQVWALGART